MFDDPGLAPQRSYVSGDITTFDLMNSRNTSSNPNNVNSVNEANNENVNMATTIPIFIIANYIICLCYSGQPHQNYVFPSYQSICMDMPMDDVHNCNC